MPRIYKSAEVEVDIDVDEVVEACNDGERERLLASLLDDLGPERTWKVITNQLDESGQARLSDVACRVIEQNHGTLAANLLYPFTVPAGGDLYASRVVGLIDSAIGFGQLRPGRVRP